MFPTRVQENPCFRPASPIIEADIIIGKEIKRRPLSVPIREKDPFRVYQDHETTMGVTKSERRIPKKLSSSGG